MRKGRNRVDAASTHSLERDGCVERIILLGSEATIALVPTSSGLLPYAECQVYRLVERKLRASRIIAVKIVVAQNLAKVLAISRPQLLLNDRQLLEPV